MSIWQNTHSADIVRIVVIDNVKERIVTIWQNTNNLDQHFVCLYAFNVFFFFRRAVKFICWGDNILQK